jgi:hypothetical protein
MRAWRWPISPVLPGLNSDTWDVAVVHQSRWVAFADSDTPFSTLNGRKRSKDGTTRGLDRSELKESTSLAANDFKLLDGAEPRNEDLSKLSCVHLLRHTL